jgi:hypothetical protein
MGWFWSGQGSQISKRRRIVLKYICKSSSSVECGGDHHPCIVVVESTCASPTACCYGFSNSVCFVEDGYIDTINFTKKFDKRKGGDNHENQTEHTG